MKSNTPEEIKVLIYYYYQHAYPKEQVDVEVLEDWIEENYILDSEEIRGKVWLRNFSRE
ncbi:MAG: hypothetical protein PSV36_00090 [Algoriphagus sp.]|nr:hypothetical protein [Algoriphagus sp.]